ncbi:O-antigen ligase family protein [Flavobacteriaceae bacterium]|nr:O-antigen ligase family protein [Flavobacteriaceae bacterium]
MNNVIYFSYIFLSILFVVCFQPPNSTDMIGPQWFNLSLINFLFLPFFIRNNLYDFLIKIFKKPIFRLFLIFSLFNFLSLFTAKNVSIYFHDLARFLSVFIFFILISYSFSKLRYAQIKSVLFVILSILLLVEFILSFYPYFALLWGRGLSIFFNINYDSGSFKGIAGNKNVTAALYVIKLPFLFYLLQSSRKILNVFGSFFLFITIMLIILLDARASYVSFAIISVLSILFSFIYLKKSFFKFFIIFAFTSCFSYIVADQLFMSNSSVNAIDSVKSISFSNESSSNRFSLWTDAIEFIYHNPLGVGLGNWKIESIPYWKSFGGGYQIPYHAHNDYLEIATETGILNSLVFLSVLFLSIFIFLKRFFIFKDPFYLMFLLAVIVYGIDAFFNFPFERTYMQLVLYTTLSFTLFEPSNSNDTDK